jgi:hypothetical protein
MIDDTWVNKTTVIQVLLDAEAGISNAMYGENISGDGVAMLNTVIATLHRQIECLRGPAPSCYGEDDCSTMILSTCPWRMTCGS